MTLEDLEKIVNAKAAFQGKKFEKFTTLTDKYLALTGITQLAGGKTIEELFAAADNKEKEIIAGKLAWCIPGGKGMGGIITPEPEKITKIISFDNDKPSEDGFTVSGSYGDGKITYNDTYYKRGVKLASTTGSVTFTSDDDYDMTIILSLSKSGRNVKINNQLSEVDGTENSSGNYYQMNPISISKNTEYTITKGNGEGGLMLIILSKN